MIKLNIVRSTDSATVLYKCPLCVAYFEYKSDLIKHLKTEHVSTENLNTLIDWAMDGIYPEMES